MNAPFVQSPSTASSPIPGIPGPFPGTDPSIPISQLPQAGPLTGGENVPIVQNGLTVRATVGAIAASRGYTIPVPQPFTTEQLTVTAPNTLSNLTFAPTTVISLYVNGMAFFPVGSSPDFSVSGQTITWLNSIYTLMPGERVVAQYTHA